MSPSSGIFHGPNVFGLFSVSPYGTMIALYR
jgi:hypothetical protein